MGRIYSYILLLVIVLSALLSFAPSIQAQTTLYEFDKEPIECNRNAPTLSCPTDLLSVYQTKGESCATDFTIFKADPIGTHFWVEDPAITAQGQADERARQFVYWVLNTNVIDEAPVLRTIWTVSSTVALFGIVLVAAIFGIGYIVSQRTDYDFKIRIRPTITKIGLMLLYTVLSAALIFTIIQFSEVLMQFFYENLGGKDLFNIYFVNPSNANLLGGTEESYKQFVGCRDLNIRVQEAANAEIFLLKLTNVTYYVMGIMLLLRKILLWFLLFVSPFLALLMPFVFIRNTGWIWIGVFFQWLFYGPLVALFLGAMSKIWAEGIPFSFDFSRAGDMVGYVYPTAINIVYGGPGQRIGIADTPIGALNNGNYIDTFAEYIITLIMLWAVVFFPWWLLRIFRDYCCEGIYAMKNALMRLYDHMRNPVPPGGPSSPSSPTMPTLKLDTTIPMSTNVNVALGSMNQIRKSQTTEIVKNMNMQASKLTDIARFETNKQLNQTVNQHLTYLANPVKAQQSNQRQQYMQLRSELFNRTIKQDSVARTILASTSTSASERAAIHKSLMQSMPQAASMSQILTQTTSIPKESISHITNTYITSIVNNNSMVSSIAQTTGVTEQNVTSILKSYSSQQSKPITTIVKAITSETNTSAKEVNSVLRQVNNLSNQSRIMSMVTERQQVSKEVVSKILNSVKTITQSSASHTTSLAQQMNTDEKTITSIASSAYESISKDSSKLQTVATSSSTDSSLVQKVITSYVQHINEPRERLISTVSEQIHTSQENIKHIMEQASQTVQSSPIVENLAQTHHMTQEQVVAIITPPVKVSVSEMSSAEHQQSTEIKTSPASVSSTIASTNNLDETTSNNVLKSLVQISVHNEAFVQNLAKETNLKEQQITNALTTYAANINKPQETIITTINQAAGIAKQDIPTILMAFANSVSTTDDIIAQVAKQENVSEDQVSKLMDTQVELTSEPEKHIEKTITIPQSISLEDYEEVKEMWIKHYEESEVPVSDSIKTRHDWLDHEIVYITNTLNKIMSEDEKLQQDGLDELGFLLPIFLINSLSGEELLVYLKAKLEAAKTVLKVLDSKESVRKELKEDEEEEVLVDVNREEAKIEAQPLHMEVDDAPAPQSIEDRVKLIQQKLETQAEK
ncbi:MAG: hypothetical protein O3B87_05430 [bacterium]|nr:hypothetical protein [bacterium]